MKQVEMSTHMHIGEFAAHGWWFHDRIAQLYDVVEERRCRRCTKGD
jgi:hypothetical protein